MAGVGSDDDAGVLSPSHTDRYRHTKNKKSGRHLLIKYISVSILKTITVMHIRVHSAASHSLGKRSAEWGLCGDSTGESLFETKFTYSICEWSIFYFFFFSLVVFSYRNRFSTLICDFLTNNSK